MKKIYTFAIMGAMLALMAKPAKAQKWEHLADTPQMGKPTNKIKKVAPDRSELFLLNLLSNQFSLSLW